MSALGVTYDIEADSQRCLITRHRSRKMRPCATCEGQIRPGQEYNRVAFPPVAGQPGWTSYAVHVDALQCEWRTAQTAEGKN